MTSYFIPSITVDNTNINDYSQFVGITAVLLIPANVNTIGWLIQNNSPNDLWWGYDGNVAVNGDGYFCIPGGQNAFYNPPAHGVYRGNVYCLSDGGGQITAKSWLQTS